MLVVILVEGKASHKAANRETSCGRCQGGDVVWFVVLR